MDILDNSLRLVRLPDTTYPNKNNTKLCFLLLWHNDSKHKSLELWFEISCESCSIKTSRQLGFGWIQMQLCQHEISGLLYWQCPSYMGTVQKGAAWLNNPWRQKSWYLWFFTATSQYPTAVSGNLKSLANQQIFLLGLLVLEPEKYSSVPQLSSLAWQILEWDVTRYPKPSETDFGPVLKYTVSSDLVSSESIMCLENWQGKLSALHMTSRYL